MCLPPRADPREPRSDAGRHSGSKPDGGTLAWVLGLGLFTFGGLTSCNPVATGAPSAAAMVVMDPLAKELACACVAGQAQRNYHQLAVALGRELDRKVDVLFSEDLVKALREAGSRPVLLVIGKESVVEADAKEIGRPVKPLARLTDRQGLTTFTGRFVVKAGDSARTVADLKGRRVFFGPPDSAEKHQAALVALREIGWAAPLVLETRPGCTEAAFDVVESKEDPPPAAVISSYALLLLEGCGSIERGALRAVGETRPVPFVTAFTFSATPPGEAQRLREALLAVGKDRALCQRMESRDGFVPWSNPGGGPGFEDARQDGSAGWTDWRGPARDGRFGNLVERFPATAPVVWKQPLSGVGGLAGVAATADCVVVADRDVTDKRDVFRCFRSADGEPLWRLDYAAAGELDYGMSPRATPVIHDGQVLLLGALGSLHAVDVMDGRVQWKKDLAHDFNARPPRWGYCSTPLVVDNLVVVNPGAPQASLVALDWRTGAVVWRTPGPPAAYASFILAKPGGRRQIIGYDAISLGGWDVATGQRLWTLVPPETGDFNVPTPLLVGDRLLVATENNGARLYAFAPDGRLRSTPEAHSSALAPDTSSPVVAADRVFGCMEGLHCLSLGDGLRQVWSDDRGEFENPATLVACKDRVLASTYHGELILFSATSPGLSVISRLRVFPESSEIYAHPALVGDRMYLRDAGSLVCLDFRPASVPTPPGLAQTTSR